jgi:hypothetical protein
MMGNGVTRVLVLPVHQKRKKNLRLEFECAKHDLKNAADEL